MSFIKSALAAAIVISGTAGSAFAQAEELRIGTASLGGAFYPVGQAIANLVTKHAEGITMVPIVTQGGVENPRLVMDGEVDIGIANANTAYFAYLGQDPYPAKLDIRSLGILHSSVLHIATLADSPIQSIEDLKGKRVAVGPAGGGTLTFLNDLFSVHGMSMEDITPSFLPYGDGFSQMTDGSLDASIALSGYPAAAVMQTTATNELRFIEIADDKLAEITEKFPYYSATNIPADVYETDGPITMLGAGNILVTSAQMSDDRAFAIVEAIYDNLEEFAAENANALQIVPEESLEIAVPLHSGAQRYFENQ